MRCRTEEIQTGNGACGSGGLDGELSIIFGEIVQDEADGCGRGGGEDIAGYFKLLLGSGGADADIAGRQRRVCSGQSSSKN